MALDDQTQLANTTPQANAQPAPQATGATPVAAPEEVDAARDRRPLESYFQEIGGTRTLKREEEVVLAKELEAATAQLRDALYAVPGSARYVIGRWDTLRAMSHTGAKLSESAGDEDTSDIAARVEGAVNRMRRHLKKWDGFPARTPKAQVQRAERAIAKELHNAQLSLALLAELREEVRRTGRELRRARKGSRRLKELESEVGFDKAQFSEKWNAVEAAQDLSLIHI